ncbi:hypothetical protein BJ322DRAFT_166490 [Thelephora terrestris]|uniref:Uncharacterized protein n=1 Tax=Thelephora terrestris TaxID=56493 RepID=A0A9P6HA61_9AGAM|nr:hypothetical protein BJ322DRAFT_166490 [Thelephora terrestris]
MEFCVSLLSTQTAYLTVAVTTTLAAGMLPSITAEAKAAELRKLFNMVEARHDYFVGKVLPKIPSTCAKDFTGVECTTTLLETLGSRLNEVEGTVSCSGVYRWSPTFMSTEMKHLYDDLAELDFNTTNTSKSANIVIASLTDDPETRRILLGGEVKERNPTKKLGGVKVSFKGKSGQEGL